MRSDKKLSTELFEITPNSIEQQIETLIRKPYDERKKAMESLSTKNPKEVLDAGLNMYKKGKGEDCLTFCSFALLNNKKPELVFECLKELFKSNSDMYMLESFIPTVCELEIDDEKRKNLLLELASSNDKDFKQALKEYLEDTRPKHMEDILHNLKSA